MISVQPKVSIITPSYNQGQFIASTIESVLNQTYTNIEYILVDGGSIDNTMEIVNLYGDRIDIVIHEKDNGQSDAINKGFKAATGDLVGWINSDDLLYPSCVEQIVNLYKLHQDGSVFYGNQLNQIDETGSVLTTRYVHISDRKCLLNTNYDLIQQGSFYPTHLVRKIGFLNEAIHYCMDLDLWLRLLEHGPIYAFSDYALAGFRKWEETKTSTGGRKFLHDIRTTLLKHGADPYSRSVLKTRYYGFKHRLKETLLAS